MGRCVFIVLGAAGGDGHITNNCCARVVKLLNLVKIDDVVILSGGAKGGNSNSEAMQMRQMIARDDIEIILEEESHLTVENALYSITLIKQMRTPARITVITSRSHYLRSRLFFHYVQKHYGTNYKITWKLAPTVQMSAWLIELLGLLYLPKHLKMILKN